MPEIVNCPQCDRKLRVPDNLLGQAVKCPTCGTTFTATPSSAPPEPPPFSAPPPPMDAPPPPPPPGPPPMPPPMPTPGELERRYAEMAPPSGSQPPPYSGGGYAPPPSFPGGLDDDEYRTRRRYAQMEARRHVEGPATALLVMGIIGIVLWIMNIALQGLGAAAAPRGGMGGGEAGGVACFYAVIGGFGIILDILIITGSQKMKGLESYGMAMTACILAMIPCNGCCLLGLPFGIWGLVALNQPGVREGFRS